MLPYLPLKLSTFVIWTLIMHWLRVCSVSLIPFGIVLWYLVEMQNRTRWHVTYKNDNFGFLTFGVISPSCVWIWFLVHSVTRIPFWNTLMIFGRNLEQDEMRCCVQERQLWLSYFWSYLPFLVSLGGSVGCTVRLETRRLQVQPPPRSATFFRGDWSWNIFYGHSLPSADSRRAVVSFWRKNVHNTG